MRVRDVGGSKRPETWPYKYICDILLAYAERIPIAGMDAPVLSFMEGMVDIGFLFLGLLKQGDAFLYCLGAPMNKLPELEIFRASVYV